MAERTLVAILTGTDLRVFERNGSEHVAQIAQLSVRPDLSGQAVLTLALTVAEAAIPANGAAAPQVRPQASRRTRRSADPETSVHAVFAWIAEHGPATRWEVRQAFPTLTTKNVGNRLNQLRLKGDIDLKNGRYTAATATKLPRRGPKIEPSAEELYDWLRVHGPASLEEMKAAWPNTPQKPLANRRFFLKKDGRIHQRVDGTWAIGAR